MATTSGGGGLGAPLGRTYPEWGDPGNTLGELIILQMTGAGGKDLPKNPFIIGKSVEQFAGPVESAKSENKGASYILHTRKPQQAKKLLTMTKLLDETNIIIQTHTKLNTCQCVISSVDLLDLTEEFIQKHLEDQKVSYVKRITRKVNGERVNTTALILTFSKTTYPKHVKVGLLRVATKPYYPNPMLCFGCFKYGHLKTRCTNTKICFNCSESYHGDECTKSPNCHNCKGNHRPGNRTCPVYKHEECIVHTKIDLNLSFPEARERVEQGNGTYAQVAAQNRLDQRKLDHLLEATQKKDEQIAKLIEITKLKDQKIKQLEQKLTKMHDLLERELRKEKDYTNLETAPFKPAATEDKPGIQTLKSKRPIRPINPDDTSPDGRSRSPLQKIPFNTPDNIEPIQQEFVMLTDSEVLNEGQNNSKKNVQH